MCIRDRFRRSRTLLVRFFHQPRLFQQKDDGRQQHELDDDARQRRYERARNKYREGIISGGEEMCIRDRDRTMLILEIFASRAVTNEGKLQTELATLQYRLPRLAGLGASLSRQGGGGGGGAGARRGAGESKLEYDRRHVRRRIDALRERLEELERRRAETRKSREKRDVYKRQ